MDSTLTLGPSLTCNRWPLNCIRAAWYATNPSHMASTLIHGSPLTNVLQYLMVDIVVNHNAWAGDASSVDYSTFYPFDSESDYHTYCTVDYTNTTSIEDCWLGDSSVELPDLKTEASNVASGYQTWISQLVSNYSSECCQTLWLVSKMFIH